MARILLADEDREALQGTAALLRAAGHEVLASATSVREAADRVAEQDPDASVVVLHDDDEHALALIDELSSFASGPVIAVAPPGDTGFVARAAERGVDALAREDRDLPGAIAVALARSAEARALGEQVEQLQGALARRAVVERAKGILMERHGEDERAAFERLRGHARERGRRVIDVAHAVVEGHGLLPGRRSAG